MRQTIALIVDAYRELNYRKLFWITLILSAVVVLLFLGVKIDDDFMHVFGIKVKLGLGMLMMDRAEFYRYLFIIFGVDIWLTTIASILALISTGGIFPDLLTGGSIDLYLSKPISRLRLFLTKYFTGLLFVALQVAAFSATSFLVLAIRGQVLIWGVFLAVPIILIFYSYLYCVCVLVGVLTRSTLAAILLTCVFWVIIFSVHAFEKTLLHGQLKDGYAREHLDHGIVREEADLKSAEATESPTLRESRVAFHQKKIAALRESLLANTQDIASDVRWHNRIYRLKTLLPKTTESVDLMKRWLTSASRTKGSNPDYDRALTQDEPQQVGFGLSSDDIRAKVDEEKILRDRPVSWVIGTSIGFEIVVVSFAAWIFCRRDY